MGLSLIGGAQERVIECVVTSWALRFKGTSSGFTFTVIFSERRPRPCKNEYIMNEGWQSIKLVTFYSLNRFKPWFSGFIELVCQYNQITTDLCSGMCWFRTLMKFIAFNFLNREAYDILRCMQLAPHWSRAGCIALKRSIVFFNIFYLLLSIVYVRDVCVKETLINQINFSSITFNIKSIIKWLNDFIQAK